MTPTYATPPAYFAEALDDAERLLKYASEVGIAVDDDTRNSVLRARAASNTAWDQSAAANLLAALGKLAAGLKPVTAESLKACAQEPNARKYWKVSAPLAVFIVLSSVVSFVTTAISDTIKRDITAANDLAVKLHQQLGYPGETARSNAPAFDSTVITELQQFAGGIREIDAQGRQLRWLAFGAERAPFSDRRGNPELFKKTFELPVPLTDFAAAASDRTAVYQDVRYFGQSLVTDVAVYYGAFTAGILPVLYALLGTCAYLSRNFEQRLSARTYTASVADSPRFLIAGIAGAVVGLFNNFAIGQGASISPLAIAFLVGYAADVFFAFLDGTVQKFTRSGVAAADSGRK
jgi:hypothetical protein